VYYYNPFYQRLYLDGKSNFFRQLSEPYDGNVKIFFPDSGKFIRLNYISENVLTADANENEAEIFTMLPINWVDKGFALISKTTNKYVTTKTGFLKPAADALGEDETFTLHYEKFDDIESNVWYSVKIKQFVGAQTGGTSPLVPGFPCIWTWQRFVFHKVP
jgi:hypothetical protein